MENRRKVKESADGLSGRSWSPMYMRSTGEVVERVSGCGLDVLSHPWQRLSVGGNPFALHAERLTLNLNNGPWTLLGAQPTEDPFSRMMEMCWRARCSSFPCIIPLSPILSYSIQDILFGFLLDDVVGRR